MGSFFSKFFLLFILFSLENQIYKFFYVVSFIAFSFDTVVCFRIAMGKRFRIPGTKIDWLAAKQLGTWQYFKRNIRHVFMKIFTCWIILIILR